MGGFTTRWVSCLNVDRRTAFATVVTSDCSYRFFVDPQNRDEPGYSGSKLAHEYCVDRFTRSAWECICRRSASKPNEAERHGQLYHAVGQLPKVDRRTAFATVITSDCSYRFRVDSQNRDEPGYGGSELAHEYCVDRSSRSAWECICRRSASKYNCSYRVFIDPQTWGRHGTQADSSTPSFFHP